MQRFELLGRNGAGANSTVFKCQDTVSGNIVAVKKLEGGSLAQVLQEAAIMRICAHQHCVELLEAYQSNTLGVMYLVMENVEHSLARELLLNPRGLPLSRVKLIAFQLAQALEQMHGKQISHGDIKPANVLITSQYSVKLCDFGSAITRILSAGADGTPAAASCSPPATPAFNGPASMPSLPAAPVAAAVTTAAASRWYCAPESLLGLDGSTPAGDIWALGCVIAELVTGKPLMPGSDEELNQLCSVVSVIGHLSNGQERMLELLPWEQRYNIQQARARGPLLDRIPKITAYPELLEALRACLHPDPAQRPTAAQLQAMPLFADLRQALQADEGASATQSAVDQALAALKRRASSGDMDVDAPAMSPDLMVPCPPTTSPVASAGISPAYSDAAAASGTGAGDQTLAPQPVRRVGGVQAAAPVRPVARNRVSALTATLRGKPFEDDSGYTDLMPQVLRLVAKWHEQVTHAENEALGPIALAARRASSMSPAAVAKLALSGDLLAMGSEQWPNGSSGGDNTMPALALCDTPIAAAAGGCGSMRPPTNAPLPPTTPAGAPTLVAASGSCHVSVMDCEPAVPETTARETAASTISRSRSGGACAKQSIPISASVGAVPFMAKAAGLVSRTAISRPSALVAATTAALVATATVAKGSPAHLRSRAIINRALRHQFQSREPRSGSVPASFLACSPSSCPRSGGLGASATLLQRERESTAAPVTGPFAGGLSAIAVRPPPGIARATGHAGRRSFADLCDLASVAECAPLACGTPPEGKRRRGLTHGPQPGSASASASMGSLQTELSLGSLPERDAAILFCRGRGVPMVGGGGGGGRRMLRSSSGGSGLVSTGSPARPSGCTSQQQHSPTVGALKVACAAARAVSMPQPIAGRGRFGAPATRGAGSAISDGSDLFNSAASAAFLREEVA